MGSALSRADHPRAGRSGGRLRRDRAGSLYLEGQQVREYSRVFEHLVATAAGARESRDLILGAIDEL